MRLRLIVDVDYDLNGADPEEIRRILEYIPQHAALEGHLTDDTPAEVESMDVRVEEVQS